MAPYRQPVSEHSCAVRYAPLIVLGHLVRVDRIRHICGVFRLRLVFHPTAEKFSRAPEVVAQAGPFDIPAAAVLNVDLQLR